MPQWVSPEAIRSARRAPLYDYLLSRHPADVRRKGNSLRLRSNHSLSIKCGYSGYTDFATGETGNAIECLTRHLDYDFRGAVAALCEYMGIPTAANEQPGTATETPPEATQPPPRVVYTPGTVPGPEPAFIRLSDPAARNTPSHGPAANRLGPALPGSGTRKHGVREP